MSKLKVYLDSSVPSAYYDNQKSARQKITQNWWHKVMKHDYEVYISPITDAELGETKDAAKRESLRSLVRELSLLEIPDDAPELAGAYIENDIIPKEYRNDALHIAVATLQGIDILVSWNFTHLVNFETRRKVKGINLLKGYKEIDIASPEELGGGKYA